MRWADRLNGPHKNLRVLLRGVSHGGMYCAVCSYVWQEPRLSLELLRGLEKLLIFLNDGLLFWEYQLNKTPGSQPGYADYSRRDRLRNPESETTANSAFPSDFCYKIHLSLIFEIFNAKSMFPTKIWISDPQSVTLY